MLSIRQETINGMLQLTNDAVCTQEETKADTCIYLIGASQFDAKLTQMMDKKLDLATAEELTKQENKGVGVHHSKPLKVENRSAPLMQWHISLSNKAKRGVFPPFLANIEPPKCAGCIQSKIDQVKASCPPSIIMY